MKQRLVEWSETEQGKAMDMLKEKALKFAAEAHKGQTRKTGEPFVTHPIAVSTLAGIFAKDHGMPCTFDAEVKDIEVVALLHDVLEDCPQITRGMIAEGFGERVCSAVEALTKQEGETYDQSITKVAEHSALACIVKLCDNMHNISTWPDPTGNKAMQWRLSAMFLRVHLTHRYFIRPLGKWSDNKFIQEVVDKYLNRGMING